MRYSSFKAREHLIRFVVLGVYHLVRAIIHANQAFPPNLELEYRTVIETIHSNPPF